MVSPTIQTIRSYELHERIGTGGFGVVYRAYQPSVGRQVAIKVILPTYANHPDFIRRFEAEAQLIARLEHLHIVPLYDYWREPDGAYLVMRWLRGGNLRDSLQRGPWTPEDATRLLDHITSALSVAHHQGVVHRDVKPANILLDEENNAYLSDFGIAKVLVHPSDITENGAIIGAPAYLSPEQARSDPVTTQSDLYSLGVVMYEVLTGEHPFPGLTPPTQLLKHLTEPLPSLRRRRPNLPEVLDAVIQRATAKDPTDRYPDVLSFAAAFRKAVSGRPVEDTTPTPAWPPLEMINPYKGLLPFEEADAADFFGREALIQQLLAQLSKTGEGSRFLAVVGPSGSGKSSAVKAGLLPALRRGALPGSENWFIVEMLPGTHPLDELEIGLLYIAASQPADLMEQLQRDERGLLRAARLALPTEDSELLLVIDQFEELFTRTVDKDECEHLLRLLYNAASTARSRVRIIITLRADFYDRPLMYPDFGQLIRQRTEVVLPLTAAELAQAIQKPATQAGAVLEDGLVTAIIADVSEQPGALPMLQYALTELFEHREGRLLTRKSYRAIGGVSGALARRAEEVYTGLDKLEQAAARQLFLRLVTLGEDTSQAPTSPDTRRRVLRAQLTAVQVDQQAMDAALGAFDQSRLLLFDRDPATRGPTVEIAHEALLHSWGRLGEWLDESRADVRMQRLLSTSSEEWGEAERDPSFLLQGTRLIQFEGWAAESEVALTQDERAYLEASIAERYAQQAEDESRRQRELEAAQKLAEAESRRAEEQLQAAQRLRRAAVYLTVALVAAGILAILAIVVGQQAVRNAATAQDASNRAITQQAKAEAEADRRATAEAIAVQERGVAEEQRRIAVSRELAAAALNNLEADPERSALLALQALSITHTLEAENALHQAVPALHLLRTLSGHFGTINGLAVSTDGTRLATASMDGMAKVWDIASGQVLLTLSRQGAATLDVAFSPDGTRLATTYGDGMVRVWEVASGRTLFTWSRHTGSVTSVAFSPDGARLATAGSDGTVRVWDAVSGLELLTLANQTNAPEIAPVKAGGVLDVVFGPDSSRLAAASADGTARIWDAISGQELLVLSGHAYEVNGLAFNPEGTRLVTAGIDGTIRVWNVGPGPSKGLQLLIISQEYSFANAVFSPDGTHLATAGWDGVARIWEVASGRETLSLFGHAGSLSEIVFSKDGTRLFSASDDMTVKIWDTSPNWELFTLVGPRGPFQGVAFSPDGTRLVTAGTDGTAQVWDMEKSLAAAAGEKLLTLSGHEGWIYDIVFSPDGTRLATAGQDMTARVWDSMSGKELLRLASYDTVLRVAFSPDGGILAAASMDGVVKIWDANSGQWLHNLVGHSDAIWSIAFNSDGERLATTSADGTIIVWDIFPGRQALTLSNRRIVLSIAFSPDGKLLAGSDQNGTTTIWDITSGEAQVLAVIGGHTGLVWQVVFSTDGTRLATAGVDGVIKVWDVQASVSTASGQELLTLSSHTGPIYDLAFSPDGTRLATSDMDGMVRLYTLQLEELVRLAQSRLTRSLKDAECRQFLHLKQCPREP